MLQFAVTDLQLNETYFEIPSAVGKWVFERMPNYNQILPQLEQGMVRNTFDPHVLDHHVIRTLSCLLQGK
jgi:hypothetical protein